MSIIAIPGFSVKTATVLKGKGEDSVGKLKVVLEAGKEDVQTNEHSPAGRAIDFGDILGALNRHQSDQEAIAVKLRFGENAFVPVAGFNVGSISLSPGKGEGEYGKIKMILEAEKDEVRAADNDITSILGAMSMHNSTNEVVSVQLRFV